MEDWKSYLEGGDLRSISKVDHLVPLIKTQIEFDELFRYLYSEDRLIVMRAVDAIEKVSIRYPEFIDTYKDEIIQFLRLAEEKEFKWHLALLVPRLCLTMDDLRVTWDILLEWAKDPKESKIVRVNSIQALFDIKNNNIEFSKEFRLLLDQIKTENVPSINARIRKLKFN